MSAESDLGWFLTDPLFCFFSLKNLLQFWGSGRVNSFMQFFTEPEASWMPGFVCDEIWRYYTQGRKRFHAIWCNLVRFGAISCDLISKKNARAEPLFCFSFLKHSLPKRGLSSRATVTKCLEFARDRYMDESKKYGFLKIVFNTIQSAPSAWRRGREGKYTPTPHTAHTARREGLWRRFHTF